MDAFLEAMDTWYSQSRSGSFYLDENAEGTSAAASLYGYGDLCALECARTVVQRAMKSAGEPEHLADDAKAMVTFYLLYGTNLSMMRAAMFSGCRTLLDKLTTIYDLRDGKQPRDVLTLAKVSLAFCGLTVTTAIKWKDRLPVPYSRMNDMVPNYPAAMMTAAFSCTIPRGEAYSSTIKEAHYLYLVELIRRLDPRMRRRPECDVLGSFKGFATSAQESSPLDETERVALMEQWGVLVDGVCSRSVVKAAEIFRKQARRLFLGSRCRRGHTC